MDDERAWAVITLFSPRSLPRSEPLPFSAPQAQGPGADGLGRIGAMTDQEPRHLAQADRHIAECKEVIARQKELIWRMTQLGQSTEVAEGTLEALRSSLQAFERHRKLIVSRLAAEN